eukprot:30545-Eustigmatos_ZCMA.PRE.1
MPLVHVAMAAQHQHHEQGSVGVGSGVEGGDDLHRTEGMVVAYAIDTLNEELFVELVQLMDTT